MIPLLTNLLILLAFKWPEIGRQGISKFSFILSGPAAWLLHLILPMRWHHVAPFQTPHLDWIPHIPIQWHKPCSHLLLKHFHWKTKTSNTNQKQENNQTFSTSKDAESFFVLGMPQIIDTASLRWTPSPYGKWWSFRGRLQIGAKRFEESDFLLESWHVEDLVFKCLVKGELLVMFWALGRTKRVLLGIIFEASSTNHLRWCFWMIGMESRLVSPKCPQIFPKESLCNSCFLYSQISEDSGTSYIAVPPSLQSRLLHLLLPEDHSRCSLDERKLFVCPCAAQMRPLAVAVQGETYETRRNLSRLRFFERLDR